MSIASIGSIGKLFRGFGKDWQGNPLPNDRQQIAPQGLAAPQVPSFQIVPRYIPAQQPIFAPPPPTQQEAMYPGSDMFRAYGGPVKRKRPYIIGENGPELFIPDQPGTIIPNPDTPPPNPQPQPQPAPTPPPDQPPTMLNRMIRTEQSAPIGNSSRQYDARQNRDGRRSASEVGNGSQASEGYATVRRKRGPSDPGTDEYGNITVPVADNPPPPSGPPTPAEAAATTQGGALGDLLRVSEAAKAGQAAAPTPSYTANQYSELPPAHEQTPAANMDPNSPEIQQGLAQLNQIGQQAVATSKAPNALLRVQANDQAQPLWTNQPVDMSQQPTARPMPEEPTPPLIQKPAAGAEAENAPLSTADIENQIAGTFKDSGKRDKSFLHRFFSGMYKDWKDNPGGQYSGGLLGMLGNAGLAGAHAGVSPKAYEEQQRTDQRNGLFRQLAVAQNQEKFNGDQADTQSAIDKRQADTNIAVNKFIQDSYDKNRAFALQKYNAMPSYKKGQDKEIDALQMPDKSAKDNWQLQVIDDGNTKHLVAFNPRTLEKKELDGYAKQPALNPEKDFPDELFGLPDEKTLDDQAKAAVTHNPKAYKLKENVTIPAKYVTDGQFDGAKYWTDWNAGKAKISPSELFDNTDDYTQQLAAKKSELRDQGKAMREQIANFRLAVSSANGNIPATKSEIVNLFKKVMAMPDEKARTAALSNLYKRIPTLRIQ